VTTYTGRVLTTKYFISKVITRIKQARGVLRAIAINLSH